MLRLPFFRATQWLNKLWVSTVYLHSLQEPSLGTVKRETKTKKRKKVPACKHLYLLVTVLHLICLAVIMIFQNLMSKELMGWALNSTGTLSAWTFYQFLKLPTIHTTVTPLTDNIQYRSEHPSFIKYATIPSPKLSSSAQVLHNLRYTSGSLLFFFQININWALYEHCFP